MICSSLPTACSRRFLQTGFPTNAVYMYSSDHTYPFLAPWKKNLTTKTCKAAIPTIIATSIMLKLKILLSVLRTVLKFRFSRVRKYFCILDTVDN